MPKQFFEDRNFPPVGFGRNGIGPGQTIDEGDAKFTDYEHVGSVLVKWARNRNAWPETIVEFMKELKAYHEDFNSGEADPRIVIPKTFSRFTIVQAGDGTQSVPDVQGPTPGTQPENIRRVAELKGATDLNGPEFVIRLPPAGQVIESQDRIDHGGGGYSLPPLYQGILFTCAPNNTYQTVQPAGGIVHKPIEPMSMLYARVADYTMRSCR